MAYRIVPFPITLNDLRGSLSSTGNAIFGSGCPASTDVWNSWVYFYGVVSLMSYILRDFKGRPNFAIYKEIGVKESNADVRIILPEPPN